MTLRRLTRTSRYVVSLAGFCLVLGLPGCGEEDDGADGGDGIDGNDGTGDDGTGGDDGDDGTSGDDGGDDGTSGDDGGDDGGDPPTCENPGGGEHDGTIEIEGDDPDTSVFDGIATITGAVIVDGTNLTDLDFMICIESIGNGLKIWDNDSLADLDGLGGLTTLTGELTIAENDGLTRLGGPSQLTTVESLGINTNLALENVDGLGGLQTVTQNLTIRYNDSLASVSGLSSLTQVANKFNVVHNPVLPCGNVASLGDQLNPPPAEAVWCDGNQGCEDLPACQ